MFGVYGCVWFLFAVCGFALLFDWLWMVVTISAVRVGWLVLFTAVAVVWFDCLRFLVKLIVLYLLVLWFDSVGVLRLNVNVLV